MSDRSLATRGANAVTTFNPQNLAEAMEFAKLLAQSDLVPKDYVNKPGNVLVAMQMGAELGIQPTQAVQGIAVINGRPAVWGDLLLAVVQKSPTYEWHKETLDEKTMTATCTMKRKGNPEPFVATFSKPDAEVAHLWGKAGPWTTHPKRMLQLRARAFCARNAFPDALKGLSSAEEVQDYIDITPEPAARIAPAMPRELPAPSVEAAPEPTPEPTAAPQPGSVSAPEVQGPSLPEGTVFITDVQLGVSGERKDKSKYQAYDISWSDAASMAGGGGREATFSRTVYEKALHYLKAKKPVKLTIEIRANGMKHITSLEPLHPDEPA